MDQDEARLTLTLPKPLRIEGVHQLPAPQRQPHGMWRSAGNLQHSCRHCRHPGSIPEAQENLSVGDGQ